jgi:hypothetical protein
MAKGQQRSNREIKKPKKDKPKAGAQTSFLSTASPKKNPVMPGNKK